MNKRNALLLVMSRIGVFFLWRLLRRENLLVINYHRIMHEDTDNPFDDGVVTCSPAVLDSQLALLKRYRNVVSMHTFLAYLRGGKSLPERPTLVTFDDGYADNFTAAFPILRQHDTPACFYLPTKRLIDRTLEWWDLTAYALKRAERKNTNVTLGNQELILELGDEHGLSASIKTVIAVVKETGASIDVLFEQLDVDHPSSTLQSSQILTDTQIREILAVTGFAIGAHSVSHTILTTMNEEQQRSEIVDSKRLLEDRFGVHVPTFAYPVGDDAHYDKISKRLAKEAGYECAFNFRRSAKDVSLAQIDRFDIDRVGANRKAGAIFKARTSGFFSV